MDNEIAWLIELVIDGRMQGWLSSEVKEFGWTTDPNKAIRFSRKIDADAMRYRLGYGAPTGQMQYLSTEHMWSK